MKELIETVFKAIGFVSILDSSILAVCTYIYARQESHVNTLIIAYVIGLIIVFLGLGIYLVTR